MNIRRLGPEEEPPFDLLLLADPSITKVKEYLLKGECYIARNDGIMGVYVLVPINGETVEIMNVAVAEEMKGKGFGKQLVLDALERAKKSGFKRVEIGTGNSSLNQLALYQKCGFRITGVDRDFFLRNYDVAIYENDIRCIDMLRLSIEFGNLQIERAAGVKK